MVSSPRFGTARRLPTGSRVPTSKDVARAAGVSQSTVSYVMSGKRPISDQTRERVQKAIDSLTYEPNAGARALAGHKTNVIGLVMPFRKEGIVHGMMEFAEELALTARHRDHDILMLTSNEGPEGLLRVSRRAMCDAIIAMEVMTDDQRAAVARDVSLPVIFIGFPDDAAGLHCIDFDFEGGAQLLVDELCDAGATEIAVLAWDEPDRQDSVINYVPRFRRQFETAARHRGVRARWVPTAFERGAADRFLDAALIEPAGLPGIIAVHHVGALSTALQRRGIVPGRDIDLVALTDHATAEVLNVPVTAVSQHPRDVSRQAMAWLFDLLDVGGAPEKRIVKAEIVRRSSVRPRGGSF